MKNVEESFPYQDLIFKKLSFDDIENIKKWGVHDSALLDDYNISLMSRPALEVWVAIRSNKYSNLYYSVYKEGQMVGYIGLKDIKKLRRYACLGISLDPNYTSKGLGTKIMEGFLDYAFLRLEMKTIFLDVNAFNERAKKLYKKMGFKEGVEYLGEFEVPLKKLEHLDIIHNEDYFVIYGGKLLSRIIEMKLTSEDWTRRQYES